MSRVLPRKMLRDLRGRKGSLLALSLIVAVGVGCFVSMAGVWRDLDSARRSYYEEYRLGDFLIEMKRAPRWAVEDLHRLPNVLFVRGRVSTTVLMEVPGTEAPLSGTAISLPSPPRPVLNDVLLRSGAWFSSHDAREVIVNDAFAGAHGLLPGSRIRVHIHDRRHELLVVGTAMSPEFVYLIPPGGGLAPDPARFGVLYMSEWLLQELTEMRGAYNQVVGDVIDADPSLVDATLALAREELEPFGVASTTPMRDWPSYRFLADELAGLRVSSAILPLIFLSVAALVLNVLLGRMVAQQRSVIGTLRALGHGKTAITFHYLSHGLTTGLAGGGLGLVLGWWLQKAFVVMYRDFFALPSIQAHAYPDLFLLGLGVSLLFSVLGTMKGVRYATRLAPADAMRPPPPETGHRILLERVTPLWSRLSFQAKVALRSILRNPFRSSVSVLASVVATALVLTALANTDALDYLMHYQFEEVLHQDYTVSVREPRGVRALDEIRALPFVAYVEPELHVACDLSNGSRRKRLGVSGLTPRSILHTPLDRAGHPIVVPDSGLVLSRKLAEILDAHPGEVIRMRPLIARRTEVSVPVTAITDTFLGLSAYCDLEYLSRCLGEEWCANTFLTRSTREADPGPFFSELKRLPWVTGVSRRTRSLTQIEETFGETMGVMIGVLLIFAGLIAFGSVVNAALVALSERQREIGTLRVLGHTPLGVAAIFFWESAVIDGLGILGGLFAGAGLANLLARAYDTELYRFPVVLYPSRLALAVAVMVSFVALAQAVVYRRIRKLDWLEVTKVRE